MIRFIDVNVRFGAERVLQGVNLHIARGQVHVIMGRSGAGKSVLIKALVGLVKAESGCIEFDGQDITHLDEEAFFQVRRRCQLVFQHATLFDALTVLDNLVLPLCKRFAMSRQEAEVRALTALHDTGVAHLAERLPVGLGTGLLKRIAIARALSLEPDVLLYDEPTTGLDPVASRRIDTLIKTVAQNFHKTSVVVTHDLTSALHIATRLSFLHQGRIHFDGSPQEFFASDDPVLQKFRGRVAQPVAN